MNSGFAALEKAEVISKQLQTGKNLRQEYEKTLAF